MGAALLTGRGVSVIALGHRKWLHWMWPICENYGGMLQLHWFFCLTLNCRGRKSGLDGMNLKWSDWGIASERYRGGRVLLWTLALGVLVCLCLFTVVFICSVCDLADMVAQLYLDGTASAPSWHHRRQQTSSAVALWLVHIFPFGSFLLSYYYFLKPNWLLVRQGKLHLRIGQIHILVSWFFLLFTSFPLNSVSSELTSVSGWIQMASLFIIVDYMKPSSTTWIIGPRCLFLKQQYFTFSRRNRNIDLCSFEGLRKEHFFVRFEGHNVSMQHVASADREVERPQPRWRAQKERAFDSADLYKMLRSDVCSSTLLSWFYVA